MMPNQTEAVMELSRVNRGTVSTQPAQPSKKSKIVMLLAQLGIRRQAKLDKEDYQVYANDLVHYELEDIEAGLVALPPKRDGQTAFPDVDTVLESIRGVIRGRRVVEASNERDRMWEERVKYCQEHPEEREMNAEVMKQVEELNAKFGFEKPKEIDTTPTMMTCPHCSAELPVAQNIRFWEPEEMRAQADRIEALRAMATKNAEVNA